MCACVCMCVHAHSGPAEGCAPLQAPPPRTAPEAAHAVYVAPAGVGQRKPLLKLSPWMAATASVGRVGPLPAPNRAWRGCLWGHRGPNHNHKGTVPHVIEKQFTYCLLGNKSMRIYFPPLAAVTAETLSGSDCAGGQALQGPGGPSAQPGVKREVNIASTGPLPPARCKPCPCSDDRTRPTGAKGVDVPSSPPAPQQGRGQFCKWLKDP